MAKLRIALCITDLEIGGAEQNLVELATRLDRERFAPAVYCLGPRPVETSSSCVRALEAAGVEVFCLGAWRFHHAPIALWRLRRLLRQQRPDLVQCFLFHANLLGRIAARWAGVPRVVAGLRVAERYSRWHLWADRQTSRMVDRYVCVSRAVADFAAAEAGIPAGKLVVIPNGIDVAKYPASSPADLGSLGVPAGRKAITFVGRLEEQKGLRWLLETAPQWLDRLAGYDLLLVGKGPQQGELEALARQGGISGRVHFAGWRADVPQILAASRLLILPSRWEGMPNVVLQAMASGLPVLATDVEGVRELLGPQAEAQTVPYGDTPAMVARIAELLENPARAADLGRQNRLRAAEEFSVERMVAAYQSLWELLVQPAA
jgi:glycosyltransferase involved in cell wall biosynthesis